MKNRFAKISFWLLVIVIVINTTITAKTTYLVNEHVTSSHTRQEIMQKRQQIKQYDYSKGEYLVKPVASAPYVAGSLQQGVIDDTLRSINFYRWLVGLNDVNINYNKMDRNQKGAVVLSKNNVLTHDSDKPSDMSQEFYDEAKAGCSYGIERGDLYSGNCSMDYSYMPNVIDGYVSDLYNISTGGGAVGHRMSILTPNAYAVSFGKCSVYSTLSMYYTYYASEYTQNTGKEWSFEPFYAFPSKGYFPRDLFATNEYWSIYITPGYQASQVYVGFEYNGQDYAAVDLTQETGYTAFSFRMPQELISALGGNSYTMPKSTIKVKIYGLNISDEEVWNIEYDVNFFDESDVVKDFSLKENNITLKRGDTKKIELAYTPNGATPENVSFSTNSNTITISEDGTIKAFRPGKATIKAVVDGIEKEFIITVSGNTDYMLGDINIDGIVNADDAAEAIEIFKTQSQKDEDLIRGDMNNDDKIDAEDAALIIEYFKTHK